MKTQKQIPEIRGSNSTNNANSTEHTSRTKPTKQLFLLLSGFRQTNKQNRTINHE